LKESANFYFEDDDFWKFDDVEGNEPKREEDEWVDDIWGDDEQEEQLGESLIDELLRDVKEKASKFKETLFKRKDTFEKGDEDDFWGEEIEDEEEYKKWHESNLRPILNQQLYHAFMDLKGVGTNFKIKLAEFLVELIRAFKGESKGKIKNELLQTGKVKTVLAKRIVEIAQKLLKSS